MSTEQLKYGPIIGEDSAVKVPCILTAAEVVRAKSGRFVTLNTTTGLYEIADDGDTLLAGWIECEETTSSATGQIALLIPAMACNTIFRIPVNAGTFVQTMVGKTCDLVRSTVGGVTLIQGAKLDASGEDNLKIVGGDLVGNKWVDVQIYQAKITGLTGVV